MIWRRFDEFVGLDFLKGRKKIGAYILLFSTLALVISAFTDCFWFQTIALIVAIISYIYTVLIP